ncbi:hypothetical protein NS365_04545 [Aureimonas ureilytica]|uniref:DUF1833 domain-containing protein n=1 Tax=Aureimonas ureilytica TaxID=401562 RepID=A0A175RV37_9HYPH|nr:DUF1833 family protein [Aureimonas ureilytica]KTR07331.1 hypothetical protein NS365_04545 [Aureimonas ureilytica]
MFGQQTGEVPVVLLTISHPMLSAPIRLSGDPTARLSEQPLRYGTASRGALYDFLPFAISLPDDVSERAPVAQIVLDNVDRTLVSMVRSIPTPSTVRIEIVLASSPDAVEIDFPAFQVQGVTFDASSMTLQLGLDDLTDKPFPAGNFDPSGFPGLF